MQRKLTFGEDVLEAEEAVSGMLQALNKVYSFDEHSDPHRTVSNALKSIIALTAHYITNTIDPSQWEQATLDVGVCLLDTVENIKAYYSES